MRVAWLTLVIWFTLAMVAIDLLPHTYTICNKYEESSDYNTDDYNSDIQQPVWIALL